MLYHLYILLAGLVFGLANVIPGVSGGTMAVVFGIYERLINLVANLRTQWRKELPFILVFGLGAGVGILAFGKVMEWILANFPTEANAFFIGIILGSIPMLFKLSFKNDGQWHVKLTNVIPMLITFAIMIPMAMAGDTSEAKSAATAMEVTHFNLGNSLLYMVYGIIAISTMIIPGISGSFVMLLMGFYGTIISAVANLNFLVLIPFAIGCLIGLISVTKLIKWLLAKFAEPSYSAILGFVFGSILCIFPGWSAILSFWPILMVVVGIAAIALCNRISD